MFSFFSSHGIRIIIYHDNFMWCISLKTKDTLSGIFHFHLLKISKICSAGRIRTYDQLVTCSPPITGGMDYIIIQTLSGCGALRPFGLLPCGIVSTPSPTLVVGAWLRIALDQRSVGFPEFTSFSTRLTTRSCLRQRAALPLSYRGISPPKGRYVHSNRKTICRNARLANHLLFVLNMT